MDIAKYTCKHKWPTCKPPSAHLFMIWMEGYSALYLLGGRQWSGIVKRWSKLVIEGFSAC